jgi:tRNA 2-thiouridine synthesizing protein D
MRFALLVLTPPDGGHSPRHALKFAQAVLHSGNELHSVFFFDAGVLTLQHGASAAQDEEDLRGGWRALAEENGTRLIACVASAERFGVPHPDRSPGAQPGRTCYEIAGLGELITATAEADRLVTFRD